MGPVGHTAGIDEHGSLRKVLARVHVSMILLARRPQIHTSKFLGASTQCFEQDLISWLAFLVGKAENKRVKGSAKCLHAFGFGIMFGQNTNGHEHPVFFGEPKRSISAQLYVDPVGQAVQSLFEQHWVAKDDRRLLSFQQEAGNFKLIHSFFQVQCRAKVSLQLPPI